MSKLDELIQEYCPDGVEYKATKDIVKESFWLMPSTPKFQDHGIYYITSKNIKNGKINFEDVKFITEDDYNNISKNRPILKGDILITMIGTIGEVSIVDIDTKFYGQNIYLLRLDNKIILNKFYYYFVTSDKIKNSLISKKNTSSQGYIKAGSIENLSIPLPPLPVQEEIVRILDNFTDYTTELIAELTVRKKQYEYYRDKLLTFEVLPNGTKEIKWKILGDVAKLTYGYTTKVSEIGDTRYIRITDINDDGSLNYFDAKYIILTEESEKYLLKKGDLLVARTGASYGKTLYVPDNSSAIYASFLIKITLDNSLILNRYYWHFSKSNIYWKQAEKLVSKGGQQQFNANVIEKIIVPIPPLSIQKRIVHVLDNFEKICSDLNIGLPAEIEARQKQYEYYRDSLLTFVAKGDIIVNRTEQNRTEQNRTEQNTSMS